MSGTASQARKPSPGGPNRTRKADSIREAAAEEAPGAVSEAAPGVAPEAASEVAKEAEDEAAPVAASTVNQETPRPPTVPGAQRLNQLLQFSPSMKSNRVLKRRRRLRETPALALKPSRAALPQDPSLLTKIRETLDLARRTIHVAPRVLQHPKLLTKARETLVCKLSHGALRVLSQLKNPIASQALTMRVAPRVLPHPNQLTKHLARRALAMHAALRVLEDSLAKESSALFHHRTRATKFHRASSL